MGDEFWIRLRPLKHQKNCERGVLHCIKRWKKWTFNLSDKPFFGIKQIPLLRNGKFIRKRKEHTFSFFFLSISFIDQSCLIFEVATRHEWPVLELNPKESAKQVYPYQTVTWDRPWRVLLYRSSKFKIYENICWRLTGPKVLESKLEVLLSPSTQQWPSGTLITSRELLIHSPGIPTILFMYLSLKCVGELPEICSSHCQELNDVFQNI